MARALVTGASGFIGSNLVRALLSRGDEVHACMRTSTNWRLADIENKLALHIVDMTDEESVRGVVEVTRPEIVFHLAHYGGNRGETDKGTIHAVIEGGTRALYKAIESVGICPVVHAGSSSEYGPKKEAMREDMPLEPDTAYGAAKAEATLLGEKLRREKNIPITTLRLFSVYGPYESPGRFFPSVICTLLRGEKPKLSSASTVRDFTYVDDVVEAMLLAPERESGVYNIGTGVETNLLDAYEAIRVAVGSNTAPEWGTIEGRSFDSASWKADTSHTQNSLGWRARMSLSEGVFHDVEWFRNNLSLYEKKS